MTEHGLDDKQRALQSALQKKELTEEEKVVYVEKRRTLFSDTPVVKTNRTLSFDNSFYNVCRAYSKGHEITINNFFITIVEDFFEANGIDMQKCANEIEPFYRLEELIRKWYSGSNTSWRIKNRKLRDLSSPDFLKSMNVANIEELTFVAISLKEEVDNLPDRLSEDLTEIFLTDFNDMKELLQQRVHEIIITLKDKYHSPFFYSEVEKEEVREDSF